MKAYTRNMNQDALYWAPAENDGQGGLIYALPVPVRCRWQGRTTLVRNAEGKEVVASAVVYVDQPLLAQGLLLNSWEDMWVLATGLWDDRGFWKTDGNWDDPELSAPPPTAKRIITTASSPSLRATEELHKVWL